MAERRLVNSDSKPRHHFLANRMEKDRKKSSPRPPAGRCWALRPSRRSVTAAAIILASLLFNPAPSWAEEPAKKPQTKGLPEGARIKVGAREYALRFLKDPFVGHVEASRKLCLWKDGTAWVIDPLHPDLDNALSCPWPIETLSADRSLAVVRLRDQKDLLAVAD